MKKIPVCLLFFCVFAVSAAAYDYNLEYLRSLEFRGKAVFVQGQPGNQYYFEGFYFPHFDPDHIPDGLLPKIQSEILRLKETPIADLPNPDWDNGNFYFVGHSQGALRALAAAAWIKDNEPELYNRLNGVITISGINRGLKALEGGIPHFRAKLEHDFQILYHGAVSVRRALSGAALPVLLTGYTFIPAYREHIEAALTFYAAMPYVPGDLSANVELFSALEIMPEYTYMVNAFRGLEIKEINDVVPGSNFINQYLVQSDGISTLSRVQDGYRIVRRLEWVRASGVPVFPRIRSVREPKYKLVSLPQTSGTLRFGDELPLGYLVGTNNNVFSGRRMNERRIRETLKALQYGLFNVKMIHMVRTASLYGLLINSPGSYTDAANAHNYIKNIDRQISEIIGSPESDSFVAKESQFFPESMHSNILYGSEMGIYQEINLNHEDIIRSKNITGSAVQLELERMVEAALSQRIRL